MLNINRIFHLTPSYRYVIKTTHPVLLQKFSSFLLLVTLDCRMGCILDVRMFGAGLHDCNWTFWEINLISCRVLNEAIYR